MEVVLDALSWACILAGIFFMVVGTIGVLRLPDVLSRMHAAGMTDTMGAGFLILGMSLQAGVNLVLVRLILVYLFLLFTAPISGHALARAVIVGGQKPFTLGSEGSR